MNLSYEKLFKTDTFYSEIYLNELFSKNYENIYLYITTIGSIMAIPAHLLLLYIILAQTPRNMKNYK